MSFSDRELCPDGACIGIIGPDGRCKECGKPGQRRATASRKDDERDGDGFEDGDDDFDDEDFEADDGGDDFEGDDFGDDGSDDFEGDDFEDEDEDVDDDGFQDDEEDDPAIERELCPDETCIGVIGRDGKCRECGLPGKSSTADPRNRNLRTHEEIDDELEANIARGDNPAAPDDFDNRRLCSDGACIGIIGDNGRCKECGKPG